MLQSILIVDIFFINLFHPFFYPASREFFSHLVVSDVTEWSHLQKNLNVSQVTLAALVLFLSLLATVMAAGRSLRDFIN